MENHSPPESPGPSGLAAFWAELKRRKVMRVAITYAVVAWLIIQVANATFESFGIPDWAYRFVVIMLVCFFPVAVILAWAFELTPEGIKTTRHAREEQGNVPVSKGQERRRNWFSLLFAAAVPTLIFGALAVFFYFRSESGEPPLNPATESPLLSESSGKEEVLSIAVLPLINMSPEDNNRFFADGVHEDILTDLSRIKDVHVISRTTMLRYAASEMTLTEMGKALHARYIVEGSVRRFENHVRVTIQLIDAHNDHHIWANNFERELVNVFAVQSELAQEISNSIHLELQPETVQKLEGTLSSNPLAYDLYLKALSIEKSEGETEDSTIRRRALLEKAVEADPEFVEAWGQLKRMYDLMLNKRIPLGWFYDTPEERRALEQDLRSRSARALAKAMSLDPDNPEALLASVVNHIEHQPSDVLAERKQVFERILAEHPNRAMTWIHYGWWHTHITPPDPEAGKRYFDKALEIDPFNVRILEIVKLFYRSNRWPTEFLDERLRQILPQDLKERERNKAGFSNRLGLLAEAFADSADTSYMEQYRSLFENSEKDDYYHRHHYFRTKLALLLHENDWEGIVAMADQFPSLDSPFGETCNPGIFDYFIVQMNALSALQLHDRTEEARAVAQKIMDVQSVPEVVDLKSHPDQGGILVATATGRAQSVLGNSAAAEKILAELSGKEAGSNDPRAVSSLIFGAWIKPKQTAERLLTILNEDPASDLPNFMATQYLVCRPLLTDPTIKAELVKQGKWISYLAERVPEYAEFRQ